MSIALIEERTSAASKSKSNRLGRPSRAPKKRLKISLRKLAANRRNARKSTGPRTPSGKKTASQNSLKHGLCSQSPTLPNECEATFNIFHEELRESLRPTHPLQLHLFSQISSILWRLQRANETEAQLYALRRRNDDPPCLTLAKAFNQNPTGNPFLLYSRYERHLRNTCLRLIRELKKIQKEDAQAQDAANQRHRSEPAWSPEKMAAQIARHKRQSEAQSPGEPEPDLDHEPHQDTPTPPPDTPIADTDWYKEMTDRWRERDKERRLQLHREENLRLERSFTANEPTQTPPPQTQTPPPASESPIQPSSAPIHFDETNPPSPPSPLKALLLPLLFLLAFLSSSCRTHPHLTSPPPRASLDSPMPAQRKKVVVAMSGGVDSSVAAALLVREGYEVLGVFMRLGSPDGVEAHEQVECSTAPEARSSKQGCCSVLDAADARRVAAALGIPLYVLNFQEDFAKVIDYFVSEYNRGRTPNPCVRCNDWLKFGKLAQYAQAVGADFVASGHYARIAIDPITQTKSLSRGLDIHKDQSYVLFGMTRQTLEHTLLPIGDFEKPAVRAIAEELKLPVYNKPDSQEICFVPDQDYAALVKRRTPTSVRPGELVDQSGQLLGEHPGHQHFTIGQRKGLKLALGHPVYVTAIDPATNRVTLAQRDQLFKKSLLANQINLLTSRPIEIGEPFSCSAKIRYNHQPQPATATLTAASEIRVDFDEPQNAITPGQAVVLYDGDVVLGGGWIEAAS